MTQSNKSQGAKLAEKQRLADALRANLRRRKTTTRGNRSASDGAPDTAAAPADENEG